MNIIDKALSNLPGHWYQGGLGDDNGNFCGIGHILYATPYEGSADNAINLMSEVAKEQYSERIDPDNRHTCKFAQFNDHPDTTEAEVIAVMEKASVRLDERID